MTIHSLVFAFQFIAPFLLPSPLSNTRSPEDIKPWVQTFKRIRRLSRQFQKASYARGVSEHIKFTLDNDSRCRKFKKATRNFAAFQLETNTDVKSLPVEYLKSKVCSLQIFVHPKGEITIPVDLRCFENLTSVILTSPGKSLVDLQISQTVRFLKISANILSPSFVELRTLPYLTMLDISVLSAPPKISSIDLSSLTSLSQLSISCNLHNVLEQCNRAIIPPASLTSLHFIGENSIDTMDKWIHLLYLPLLRSIWLSDFLIKPQAFMHFSLVVSLKLENCILY